MRLYLREMGAVPLLTRDGEVEIARRIERGQSTVLKSLSRAPLAIQEIIAMNEEMAKEILSARDVLQINDPILTDEMVEAQTAGIRPRPWRISPSITNAPCRRGRN